MSLLNRVFGSYSQRELKRIWPIADKVLAQEAKYAAMSEDELRGQTALLRQRLAEGETLDDILTDAFAICREAAWRVLGMKHFPVQVVGGVVLHQGRISEMKTGEGKTLVATLPAYLNALSGDGVHIVTVNDYLAKRDSEWMGKVYRYLGLSVGLIVNGLSPAERKVSYAADITYGTNNEFGFDYLRDNMVTYKENQVQRGHNYAIVDEVDSILIDEARTPLIISGAGAKSTELYALADRFAKSLKMTKVKELDAKQDNDLIEGDYIVDEKARTATLTAEGVRKAERHFNVENLTDPDNMTLSHHINQAIKAVGIMKRDVDYVVKDGEVIIVDEFTGRLMIGRRYNEGLHQAIEAKEGVVVAKESKTLATITFQNYFRMYKKLSGMTGTALTEEEEFRAIYSLDVIEIPTNRPIDRTDLDDVIYQTETAKFRAVIDTAAECHSKGQPVLVGTVSIERSELLSTMLSRRGIKHEVLNAKQHEREAQIVAQAGKYGAVTIATNMAGRGTDIMLGGNPEYMAKNDMRKEGYDEELIEQATGFGETADDAILGARARFTELFTKHRDEISKEADAVRGAGGLYIIGTERHESRRIDNQLRGRSGRQGDPGMTKFFLSLEDDLLRLFGGERLQTMMDGLKLEEDTPIEAKILSNTIQNAQAKVESRNFAARKNVLQFDDVMNRQREIIYGQRGKVLAGEDISDIMRRMVEESVGDIVDRYLGITDDPHEWNAVGLREYLSGWLVMPGDYGFTPEQLMGSDRESIKDALRERAFMLHENRERAFTPGVMRDIERMLLLRNVDSKWMDHIDAMDDLKRGIYLRSYGQKDPVVEYRLEGSDMFEEMIAAIREDTVRMLLTVQLRQGEAPKREQIAQPAVNTSGDGSLKKAPAKNKPGDKVGRNDPCPCGSGLKYKKCCGK